METIKATYAIACDGCGKPHRDRDEYLCPACKGKLLRTKIQVGDAFYMHRQSVEPWRVVAYDTRSDSYRVRQAGDLDMTVSAAYLLGHDGGQYRDRDGAVIRVS